MKRSNDYARKSESKMKNQTDTAIPRHGARVYLLAGKLLVKQTVLRGTPPEYVVDSQKEIHVDLEDDGAIADAIRAAVSGKLG
jgi:hypothetical protein